MAEQATNSSSLFADSIHGIVDRWRMENPRARSIPRSVRREINLAIREDHRRQALDYQRARLDIEAAVRDHQHNMLVGYRPRIAEPPETWFARQQQLERERLAIEHRINAETRLSAEDRGQAVTSLSMAHHAPSVPRLPVFTPAPARGLQALRARLQANLARLRSGLVGENERRRLEGWEQLHRERAEQAQRLQGRDGAIAVNTALDLGLGENPVSVSRDTHEQREERLAQLETTAADRDARMRALEETVAALRADNERLTHATTALTAERDQLATQLDGTVQQWLDADSAPSGQRPDPAATNLIATAHPKLGTPMPARSGNATTADGRVAAAAPSAAEGLEV